MSEAPIPLVTVTDGGGGRYSQRVTVGRHVLSADEPPSRGGQDIGPSPNEYLLAGLGACTAITVRMYAERHDWSLRRTTIEVEHKKIVATDGKSQIDHFYRTIHLEGDLTEEQRLRIFQIADKCPVSEILRHAAVVISTLASVPSPIPD